MALTTTQQRKLKTFVRHERFMDVCCEIIAIGPDGLLLVDWWNMGYVKSYKINDITNIRTDLSGKWLWAEGYIDDFLRELKWERLV